MEDRRNQKIVALIVGSAFFMQNLDSTIVATALPEIAATFGEQPVHLSITIISYMLGQSVFMPVSAWAADRFGANMAFRGAITVFTVASVLCGFSETLWQLTAARLLQGIGGAMMMPVGRLLLLRTVEKSEFVRASTYLALLGQIGPMLGPPIGGLFATYASWRWIFLVNVPIGIIGVLLASKYVKNYRAEERPPFDGTGFMVTGIALSCIMYGLDSTGRATISPMVVVALLCAGVALLGFTAWRSLRVAHPLLDFSLFKGLAFRINVTGGLFFRFSNATSVFLLPLLFQVGFGMTAFKSGVLLFIFSAGAMAARQFINIALRHFSFRSILAGACSVLTVILPLFALLSPDTPIWVIIALLVVTGGIQSFTFITLNALAYSDIPPEKMSGATTLGQLGNQAGNSLGVALAAALLHILLASRGGETALVSDFDPAFVFMGLCALCAVPFFLKMPADLGEELRGKKKSDEAAPGS